MIDPNNEKEYWEATKKHYELTQGHSGEIAQAFHLNEIEQTNLEHQLNIQEKLNRLPPALPHEYSWPDFGLDKFHADELARLFPLTEESAEHKTNTEKIRKRWEYPGVFLSIFQWGWH